MALVELLETRGWLTAAERRAMGRWGDPTIRNWRGIETGRITTEPALLG